MIPSRLSTESPDSSFDSTLSQSKTVTPALTLTGPDSRCHTRIGARVFTSRVPNGHGNVSCKCHTVAIHPCSDLFRRAFRRFFPSLRGEPCLARRCSKLGCSKSNSSRKQHTVVLRSIFLTRAILLSVTSRCLKVRLFFKTYPLVSETSEVVIYANCGDFERLKRCIITGKATPCDIGQDGWSILHVRIFQSCGDFYLTSSGADRSLPRLL